MKSKIFMLFVALMLVLTACGGSAEPAAEAPVADAPAADAPAADAPAEETGLEGVPEAFTGEPLKVAVIRNLPSDDHTKQFLDGARTEGESFGMVVDTFIADNEGVSRSLCKRIFI